MSRHYFYQNYPMEVLYTVFEVRKKNFKEIYLIFRLSWGCALGRN